jgi:hypothetical protein
VGKLAALSEPPPGVPGFPSSEIPGLILKGFGAMKNAETVLQEDPRTPLAILEVSMIVVDTVDIYEDDGTHSIGNVVDEYLLECIKRKAVVSEITLSFPWARDRAKL